jgi:hypothetical protein
VRSKATVEADVRKALIRGARIASSEEVAIRAKLAEPRAKLDRHTQADAMGS